MECNFHSAQQIRKAGEMAVPIPSHTSSIVSFSVEIDTVYSKRSLSFNSKHAYWMPAIWLALKKKKKQDLFTDLKNIHIFIALKNEMLYMIAS